MHLGINKKENVKRLIMYMIKGAIKCKRKLLKNQRQYHQERNNMARLYTMT